MTLTWWLTSELNISWTRMFLRIFIVIILYIGSLWLARAQILRESIDYIFHKKRV